METPSGRGIDQSVSPVPILTRVGDPGRAQGLGGRPGSRIAKRLNPLPSSPSESPIYLCVSDTNNHQVDSTAHHLLEAGTRSDLRKGSDSAEEELIITPSMEDVPGSSSVMRLGEVAGGTVQDALGSQSGIGSKNQVAAPRGGTDGGVGIIGYTNGIKESAYHGGLYQAGTTSIPSVEPSLTSSSPLPHPSPPSRRFPTQTSPHPKNPDLPSSKPSMSSTFSTSPTPHLASSTKLFRVLSSNQSVDRPGTAGSRKSGTGVGMGGGPPGSGGGEEEKQGGQAVYRKLNSMDPIVARSSEGRSPPAPISFPFPPRKHQRVMQTHTPSRSHQNQPYQETSHRRTRTITPAEDYVRRFRQESGELDATSGGTHGNANEGMAGESASLYGSDRDPTGRYRSDTFQTMGTGTQSYAMSPMMGGGTPRGRQYTKQSHENLFGESPYSTDTNGSGRSPEGQGYGNRQYPPAGKIPLVKRLVSSKPLALSFNKVRNPPSSHDKLTEKDHAPHDAPLAHVTATAPRSRQRSIDSSTEPTGLGMGFSPYAPVPPSGIQSSWTNIRETAFTSLLPEPPVTLLDKLVLPTTNLEVPPSDGWQVTSQQRPQSDWQAHQRKKDFLANESEEQRRRRERERVQVWSAWAVACIAVQSSDASSKSHSKLSSIQTDVTDGRSGLRPSRHRMSSDEARPYGTRPGSGLRAGYAVGEQMMRDVTTPQYPGQSGSVSTFDQSNAPSGSSGTSAALPSASHTNPFLAIRTRTANATVRSLVIEMIVSLAALVDGRELVYGESIPLNDGAQDMKRNRSSALQVLRAERAMDPDTVEPDHEDLAFQESEFASLVDDLDDCIGHGGQVDKLLRSGRYGIQLTPFKIDSSDGALRLLIDLEETIWGSMDPTAAELPGFLPSPLATGGSANSQPPGGPSPSATSHTPLAKPPVPANNLNDLLDMLGSAPASTHAGGAKAGYLNDVPGVGKLNFDALEDVNPTVIASPDVSIAYPSAASIAARGRRSTEPVLHSLPSAKGFGMGMSLVPMEEEVNDIPRADGDADLALKTAGRARYEAWKASREMQPLWAKDTVPTIM